MKNEKKEVLVTDEFVEWYQNLGEKDAEAVYHYVGLLEARGTETRPGETAFTTSSFRWQKRSGMNTLRR